MHGIKPVIPPKANRKDPPVCDFRAYKARNRIERMFNRRSQRAACPLLFARPVKLVEQVDTGKVHKQRRPRQAAETRRDRAAASLRKRVRWPVTCSASLAMPRKRPEPHVHNHGSPST